MTNYLRWLAAVLSSLQLAGCAAASRIVTDGPVSLQINKNWNVQSNVTGRATLQRRVPFWDESMDALGINSHLDCMSPNSIAHTEQAFADAFRVRNQTPHFFALTTKAGTASCVSNTSNLVVDKEQTEFLQCYLPEANVLFAGNISHEAEATEMIASIKSERSCTPNQK